MVLPDFEDLHVLVLGDIMIDRYQYGTVTRISPEAPIPVVELQNTEDRLGGAGNVALNLVALGAKTTIIGLSGNDGENHNLERLFDKYPQINSHLIQDDARKTSVKTRILSQNQHLLRIDHESTHDISTEVEGRIINIIKQTLTTTRIDGIILQDYNKGFMSEGLIQKVMQLSIDSAIPTFVDPKLKNFFSYVGCTVFKPNRKEILEACKIGDPNNETTNTNDDIEKCEKLMRSKLKNKISFVTLGSKGIYTVTDSSKAYYETEPRVIADVCGAGDTVLSILTLCYLKNVPLDKIAKICNVGGGQVCEKPGVIQVNRKLLAAELVNK